MELQKYETITDMILSKLDRMDLTQIDLANAIDADTTTISRNLSDKTLAPYPKLKLMWDTVKKWEDEQTQPAEELMITEFVSTNLEETRKDARAKMLDGNFSQLPVRKHEDGDIIGIVTDMDLMKVHDDEKIIDEIGYSHLIRIERDASRQLVEDVLEEGHSAVLVVDGDSPVGFITKYDLLKQGPELRSTVSTDMEDSE